ncbi:hypothetical protein ARMGADRAFT_1034084 [Armillaria gallica]|uniref:Uncharacterized protein n=1 Tax=Armillaria gallica TaxID=47427 RepID=A0A2H3CZI3_ARMGA|nr:hypothetical protein ARMGADRAFT_1034084 [Armillaria gallica]
MSSEQKVLRLMHRSFDDFLQDKNRSGEEWFIDVEEHKRNLARPNATKDVSAQQCRDRIPAHICHYAVLGPAWHINSFNSDDFGAIEVLFDRHFLSWLEVIVTLGTRYLKQFRNRIYDVKYWIQEIPQAGSNLRFGIDDAVEAADKIISSLLDPNAECDLYNLHPADIYPVLKLLPPKNVIRRRWEQHQILNISAVSR